MSSTLVIDPSMAKFEAKASEAASLMKALANEKRLMILCKLLEHGEMSVLPLSEQVGLSQSALSQHLAKMREEQIVGFRRDAQTLYYRVADKSVIQILSILRQAFC